LAEVRRDAGLIGCLEGIEVSQLSSLYISLRPPRAQVHTLCSQHDSEVNIDDA